jgi:hypothetical protein
MVQYLKICSVSTTNPVDMFTLGVSTARGVDGKIGQFGSGSLMSTLLWLRLHGESPIFMLNGARVEFESRPERTTTGGVFHRVYQTVDGVETPLSVALEYGEIDWTESHMALREWISNAIDQGADIVAALSKVDSLECEQNEVCVFVPMNAEVRKYWNNVDKYFLHFKQNQDSIVLPKAKPSICRLYRKGVFVRELTSLKTLFDYNLPIDINECRTGSSDSMESTILDTLHGHNMDVPQDYFHTVFHAILQDRDCWEAKNPTSYLYGGWRNYLNGEQVKGVKLIRSESRQKGEGTRVDGTWYNGFIKINPALSGYADLFTEKHDIIEQQAPPEVLALANRCWKFLTTLVPTDKAMPNVFTFKTADGGQPSYLGRYDDSRNRIFIWHDQKASGQTIIEEMAHAISGHPDCTRAFQEYLFRCLTECFELID